MTYGRITVETSYQNKLSITYFRMFSITYICSLRMFSITYRAPEKSCNMFSNFETSSVMKLCTPPHLLSWLLLHSYFFTMTINHFPLASFCRFYDILQHNIYFSRLVLFIDRSDLSALVLNSSCSFRQSE